MNEISALFDRLQYGFDHLAEEERAKCGLKGVAVEIALKIDMKKREIVLDKLYKYCKMEVHLFTELLQILQRNFQDFTLIVPSLQGYELAREIYRFLGAPTIECIYLKGDTEDRLLMGEALKDATLRRILDDTEKHYNELGGLEKRNEMLENGLEVSMYHRGQEGEEEVLWMQVKIPLLPGQKIANYSYI